MTRISELNIFNKIASNIGQNHRSLPTNPITGFMAMVGELYSRELMVVGRAVNGWTTGRLPEGLHSPENTEAFVKSTFGSVEKAVNGESCPMRWVTLSWGNKVYNYNTRGSAFWRVIRDVVSELNITNVEDPAWPSHLVWSNLYKIAPAKGGNPSGKLCSLQFEGCKSLLQEELSVYSPKRILFLTGLGWAQSFLTDFHKGVRAVSNYKYVEASGRVQVSKSDHMCIVVAAHPQSKKEGVWVQEVISVFQGL